MSRQNKEKQGAKETKTSVTVLMGCTAFLSTDFGTTYVTYAHTFSCP